MTEIKAMIVDDEVNSAKALKSLLATYCPDVTVVAMAHSSAAGIECIRKTPPDLLFLDIEMPITNGFQMLTELGKISFEVIFATAFEQFALEAFKTKALSYILKPIDYEELMIAVEKFRTKSQDATVDRISKIEEVIKEMRHLLAPDSKLAVHTSEGVTFLDPAKIIRLEADSNYTHIFLVGGKKITSAKTMKEYEDQLHQLNFFRIHSAHLVNLRHIERYIKGEGGYLITSDNSMLEVSRRRKSELLNVLFKISKH